MNTKENSAWDSVESDALLCKGDWLRNLHTGDQYMVERVEGFDAIIRLKDGVCIRISKDQRKHWEVLKKDTKGDSR